MPLSEGIISALLRLAPHLCESQLGGLCRQYVLIQLHAGEMEEQASAPRHNLAERQEEGWEAGSDSDSSSEEGFDPRLIGMSEHELQSGDESLCSGWLHDESERIAASAEIDSIGKGFILEWFIAETNAVCDRAGCSEGERPVAGRILRKFLAEEIALPLSQLASEKLKGSESVCSDKMMNALITLLPARYYRASFTNLFDERSSGWMRQDLPAKKARSLTALRPLAGSGREH